MKKRKQEKVTRYSNSVIYYKSLSCRANLYEDRQITYYCKKKNLSKNIFLTAAAMYCIKNDIDVHELLNSTTTSENFDYNDYRDDDYE